MMNHPAFQREDNYLSLDEIRRMANMRQMIIWNEKFYTITDVNK